MSQVMAGHKITGLALHYKKKKPEESQMLMKMCINY